ncbi:hypothetical protein LPJ56_001964, partial [Coemansia sp. RSA 2599]
SVIIKPLEASFIEYLTSDGIVLPEDEEAPEFRNKIEDDSSDDGNGWSDDEDSGDEPKPQPVVVNIDATSAAIREAIDRLGGKVFPRMNWSAPTDATWMTYDNTLQCRSLSEVLIVLKGSDKISEDIDGSRFLPEQEMAGDWEHELVLRQWCNLYPSMEFRCFVRNKRLVAISQIEMQHYEFLEGMREEIESSVQRLYDQHVCSQFGSESYCFDVYITQESGRTYVIDFEPWCEKVDSCLYLWQEILGLGEGETLGLRLFPDSLDGMRHYSSRFSRSQFPKDLDGEELNTSITEFIKKMTMKQAEEEQEEIDD